MKLLLVNSNSSISRLIKLCCEKYDYQLDETDSPDIPKLAKLNYDITYVDDEMYTSELLAELKKEKVAPSIGVILPKKSTKPADADFALHKPFLPTDFIDGAMKIVEKQPTTDIPDLLDDENLDLANLTDEKSELEDFDFDNDLKLEESTLTTSINDDIDPVQEERESEVFNELDDLLSSIEDEDEDEEIEVDIPQNIAEKTLPEDDDVFEMDDTEDEMLLEEINFEDDLDVEESVNADSSEETLDDLDALINEMSNNEDNDTEDIEKATRVDDAQIPPEDIIEDGDDEFDIGELSGLLDPDTLSDDDEEIIENPLQDLDSSIELEFNDKEETSEIKEDDFSDEILLSSEEEIDDSEDNTVNLEEEEIDLSDIDIDNTEEKQEIKEDVLDLGDLDADDDIDLDSDFELDDIIFDDDEQADEKLEINFDINNTEFIKDLPEDTLLESAIKTLSDLGLDSEPIIEGLDDNKVLNKDDVNEIKSLINEDTNQNNKSQVTSTDTSSFSDLDMLDENDIKFALDEEIQEREIITENDKEEVLQKVTQTVQETVIANNKSSNLDDLLAAAIKEKISKAISDELVKKVLDDMELNITLNFKDKK